MKHHTSHVREFTPLHQRLAGEQRARGFTSAYQKAAAQERIAQASFLVHNRTISRDGYAGVSAHFRAQNGLRLLYPEHIQFLRPEEFLEQDGLPLPAYRQRLQFGLYVWRMIWDQLPFAPALPTDEEYLQQARRVQALVGRGLQLETPLDALYVAPDDYCDASGRPLAERKQKKLFRAALRQARAAALQWHDEQVRSAHPLPPRKPGQRRPMGPGRPVIQNPGW
jgi:hypothetical protein